MTNLQRTVAGMLAVVAVLGLGGCYVYPAATVQNINTSFAGKQVDEFFLKHGAPVGKYELADGGAIYTWHSEVSTVHVPGSSHTYINNSGYGVTAHTTHTGGFDVKRYSKLEIVTNPDNKIVEIKLAEDTRGHWKLSRFEELFNEYNPPPVPLDPRMVARARAGR